MFLKANAQSYSIGKKEKKRGISNKKNEFEHFGRLEKQKAVIKVQNYIR